MHHGLESLTGLNYAIDWGLGDEVPQKLKQMLNYRTSFNINGWWYVWLICGLVLNFKMEQFMLPQKWGPGWKLGKGSCAFLSPGPSLKAPL